MACLDDPTVLLFVTGGLDDLAHRRVEEEVGRCGRCAALVAALIRDHSSAPADSECDDGDAAGDGAGRDEAPARYVLGRVIARGGMGTIVAAFDRQLDRPVAIKRLDSDRAELAVRFAREIRVTASLQHPGHMGSHVRVEPFVAHGQVLPRARALVTHGGWGALGRALRHGVPALVIPPGGPSLVVAARAAELGLVRHLPLGAGHDPARTPGLISGCGAEAGPGSRRGC